MWERPSPECSFTSSSLPHHWLKATPYMHPAHHNLSFTFIPTNILLVSISTISPASGTTILAQENTMTTNAVPAAPTLPFSLLQAPRAQVPPPPYISDFPRDNLSAPPTPPPFPAFKPEAPLYAEIPLPRSSTVAKNHRRRESSFAIGQSNKRLRCN